MGVHQLCIQQSSLKGAAFLGAALGATSSLWLLQAFSQPTAFTDRTHVCNGEGRILTGAGAGGRVQLSLVMNHGVLLFTDGPSKGERLAPVWVENQTTLKASQGEWRLTHDRLETLTAVFYALGESQRVIEYSLDCEVGGEVSEHF